MCGWPVDDDVVIAALNLSVFVVVVEQEDGRDRWIGGLGVTGPPVCSFFILFLCLAKSKQNLFVVLAYFIGLVSFFKT